MPNITKALGKPAAKRIQLLILLLLAATLCACTAEQPCTVKFEQSPELRGFRLGMSVSDVQKRFVGFPAPIADELGLATIEISNRYSTHTSTDHMVLNFVDASPYAELSQLKHTELKFLDGRLIEITVYYPNDLNWKSGDEFARKTGEALKLNGTWRKVGSDDDYSEIRSLYCGEVLQSFSVLAGLQRSPLLNESAKLPYVQLKDFMRGEMEVFKRKRERDERKNREEQERKDTFKP